jgi:hypothetical protein
MSGKGAFAIYQELTGCRVAFEQEARVLSISSLSFWQQNQNWRIQQQRWSDTLGTSSAVSSVLTSALTSQATGLAAIANNQALVRVTQQLKAAATSALGSSGLSTLNTTSSSLKSTQSSSSSTANSLNLLT